MCQEIMAPQVEYGEETLAPTEADETQQQPEKSRCVHVCLHSLERGICSLSEFVFCARARMDAALVFLCVHLPAKDLTFFVFHARHLGLSVSISHRGGMSWKTKLRGLNISSVSTLSRHI